MSRPILFDETKQREFLAMITVGCTRATAAEYCGVSLTTVRNAARKHPAFAERLKRAEILHEFKALRNIHAGAKTWRASAWLLERTIPSRYARRGPTVMTDEECDRLVTHLAAIVTEILPDVATRDAFIARFDKLVEKLYPAAVSSNDDKRPDRPRSAQEWHDEYLSGLPFSIQTDEPLTDHQLQDPLFDYSNVSATDAQPDRTQSHTASTLDDERIAVRSLDNKNAPNRADSSQNSSQQASPPPATNDD